VKGTGTTNVTRAQALAGTAMVLASARAAFAQSALTPIRVASSPVADVVPLLYAQNSGMFQKAGLDVTLTKATSGSAVAAAVAGGAADIGKVSTASIITAHSHGIPLTIVFPDRLHTFGAQAETMLVVAPDSPIKIGRDLNGKTISVGAIKDSTWIGARLFIDSNGGDSSTAKFVELPFATVGAAIAAGRIDAGVANDPYLKADVRAGKVRALGDMLAALGSKFLETEWVAMGDYIAKNRDVVARYRNVIRDAQIWCNAHVSDAQDLAAAFTGIDRATLATTRSFYAVDADPRDVQPYVTACARYEIIPKTFDAAELYMR
jgi:NitT/TauT family transport system substrate-binding protein